MSITKPFHCVEQTEQRKVYHDNGLCELGVAIPAKYLELGTDDRPLCPRCRLLNQLDK